ncbi:FMN reductase [Flexivirga endophytica]|uniref:FMN reductase n=1 Tax=Flexivirga endophytica TaxID=1849103 RepID=A0A916T597_9MICO|nr:NADPH-dependent FMN reductase [Flexivirga endophytica]GGB32331.1 FMN reductase [Flexivirga endophytica]GHB53218.1 FMN reductase [Flexivirga endophytica]
MTSLRIAIIIGSTRPDRVGPTIADWAFERAAARGDASYDLIDLAHVGLPLLDEPEPAAAQHYRHDHTKRWSRLIESYDGFVFVAPEYNRGMAASLKNAIDFLYAEWNDKAAGIICYGSSGGLRSGEQLKSTLGEVQIATVRAQVSLSIYDDMIDFVQLTPRDYQVGNLDAMLDSLLRWAGAMRALRTGLVNP